MGELTYEYLGVEYRTVRAFEVKCDGVCVAGGVDCTDENGSITIRIHGYHSHLKNKINALFAGIRGVKEVVFSNPL